MHRLVHRLGLMRHREGLMTVHAGFHRAPLVVLAAFGAVVVAQVDVDPGDLFAKMAKRTLDNGLNLRGHRVMIRGRAIRMYLNLHVIQALSLGDAAITPFSTDDVLRARQLGVRYRDRDSRRNHSLERRSKDTRYIALYQRWNTRGFEFLARHLGFESGAERRELSPVSGHRCNIASRCVRGSGFVQ